MPQPTPKFRNQGESRHWSRVQSGTLATFNWPAKRKTRPEMVVTLASEIADLSLVAFRARAKS